MSLPPVGPSSAPAPQRVRSRNILTRLFVGEDGLRALWAILLFFLLQLTTELFVYSLEPSVYHVRGLLTPAAALRSEIAQLAGVLVATLVLARIDRRPLACAGLGRSRAGLYLALGLLSGLGALSLLVALLRGLGLLVFDARLLDASIALRSGLVWLAVFGLVGLVEELLNRGYLQFRLTLGLYRLFREVSRRRADASASTGAGAAPVLPDPAGERNALRLAFGVAAILLSCWFGLGHRTNAGESPLGLLAAALAGLLFCLSLWRTGSLWWAIGFHAAWDWAQSFLYGTADSGLLVTGRLHSVHAIGPVLLSGGATGPEGSLLTEPVLALVAVLLLVATPPGRPPCLPPSEWS